MKKVSYFKSHILNKSEGFTLIELLIVIVIISVLATFLMVNFIGVRQRGRDAERKSDLRQIQSALELYRSDQGSYPLPPLPFGSALTGGSPAVTYMQKVPKDPLNSLPVFIYTYTSDTSTYTLQACLENVNDPQKDSSSVSPCDTLGKTSFSFTLTNP